MRRQEIDAMLIFGRGTYYAVMGALTMVAIIFLGLGFGALCFELWTLFQ